MSFRVDTFDQNCTDRLRSGWKPAVRDGRNQTDLSDEKASECETLEQAGMLVELLMVDCGIKADHIRVVRV